MPREIDELRNEIRDIRKNDLFHLGEDVKYLKDGQETQGADIVQLKIGQAEHGILLRNHGKLLWLILSVVVGTLAATLF